MGKRVCVGWGIELISCGSSAESKKQCNSGAVDKKARQTGRFLFGKLNAHLLNLALNLILGPLLQQISGSLVLFLLAKRATRGLLPGLWLGRGFDFVFCSP